MTAAQASYLKTLSEQAHEPAAFHERLTKAQASKEIDRLREKIGANSGRLRQAACANDDRSSTCRSGLVDAIAAKSDFKWMETQSA